MTAPHGVVVSVKPQEEVTVRGVITHLGHRRWHAQLIGTMPLSSWSDSAGETFTSQVVEVYGSTLNTRTAARAWLNTRAERSGWPHPETR